MPLADDDIYVTRWQRWHRRVMALNLDALLRWTLVATTGTLTIFSLLAVMHYLGSLGVTVVTTLWSWLP